MKGTKDNDKERKGKEGKGNETKRKEKNSKNILTTFHYCQNSGIV
jgi:hypothetical protein